jgi:uncharacterized protein
MPAQQTSARKIDENGFLFVKGCPISSFGIFDYSAGQLGLPGDPNRIVKVFRPESAVNNPETIESFKNKPFIVDHEMLSGFQGDETTTAPEEKGIDGVLTSNVYYEKPWLRGDLQIFSRKAQGELDQNKKDLSLGYTCDFELKPGMFNGQHYEVVQTNMRGNHIALVDEGRVPGARVLDGHKMIFDHLKFDVRPSDEDQHMQKRALDASAVEQLKASLAQVNSAFQAFLSEEQQEPEHQEGAAAGGGSSEGDVVQPSVDDPDQAGAAEAGEEGGGSDLPALLSQVEQLLASIRSAIGGEGAGDEGGGEGMTGSEGQANEEGATVDEGHHEETEGATIKDGEGEGQGTPEGLTSSGAVRASEGPAAGRHPHAGDAAVRRFYADSALKGRIYNRLSSLVGAFDSASMDAHQVYAYGLKKLQADGKLKNVNAADAKSVVAAVDAYLDGLETAKKQHRNHVQQNVRRPAGDSALPSDDSLDAYLAGSK